MWTADPPPLGPFGPIHVPAGPNLWGRSAPFPGPVTPPLGCVRPPLRTAACDHPSARLRAATPPHGRVRPPLRTAACGHPSARPRAGSPLFTTACGHPCARLLAGTDWHGFRRPPSPRRPSSAASCRAPAPRHRLPPDRFHALRRRPPPYRTVTPSRRPRPAAADALPRGASMCRSARRLAAASSSCPHICRV